MLGMVGSGSLGSTDKLDDAATIARTGCLSVEKEARAPKLDSPVTVSPALRAGGRALRAHGAGCATL